MVQSGYKFRTGLASNYIVYRGLQINYFRIQKKGPFLSECVEICYKIKSFSQKQQTLSDKFNRNVIRPAFRRETGPDPHNRTGRDPPENRHFDQFSDKAPVALFHGLCDTFSPLDPASPDTLLVRQPAEGM